MSKYAQHNEEEIIAKYLGHIKKGKYVDVGAGHSKDFSNTYALYELGWRGICIDPYKMFIDDHNKVRPEDINLNMAITNYDGEVEMCDTGTVGSYIGDQYVLVGTPRGTKPPVRKEKCMTMNTLISLYPEYANADFFSLDVETNEDKVLECCDFTKFTPTLLIIENVVRNQDYRENWIHYLNPYYNLVETIIGNLAFLRK